MKKLTILSIFIAATLGLLSACNTKQAAAQGLKDDGQRKDIMSGIIHNQPYAAEMMHEMMNNDSCKNMMGESMMKDTSMMKKMMPNMMGMCGNDTLACKMMMGKMADMCDADAGKCDMMMGTMKKHPKVKKAMEDGCKMDNMGKMDNMDMMNDTKKSDHAGHHQK
jgi:hypothetical protein